MSFRVFIHNEEDSRTLAHLFNNTGIDEWTVTDPVGTVEIIRSVVSTIDDAVSIYVSYKWGLEPVDWHLIPLDSTIPRSNGDYACIVRNGKLPPCSERHQVDTSNRLNSDAVWRVPTSPTTWNAAESLTRFSIACNDTAVRLREFCDQIPSQPTFPRRRYLTMMPYSSYEKTAKCLTLKDLKRMRVVALRVFYAIKNSTVFTQASPSRSVDLWRTDFQSLIRYGIMIGKEIKLRGSADSSIEVFQSMYIRGTFPKPPWVYWPRLQDSHKAYLKLREYRNQVVSGIHNRRLDSHQPSLSQYLRTHSLPAIRNLTCSDIFNIIPPYRMSSGHYSTMFNNIEATEDFVFPGRP